jgi:hypothetical protein
VTDSIYLTSLSRPLGGSGMCLVRSYPSRKIDGEGPDGVRIFTYDHLDGWGDLLLQNPSGRTVTDGGSNV